ncbi:MAG TPA: PrgI family protein [Candidatus Bathyarchaeia archaeon]|nr:PrgI family protein [Candidatus Bathyarchaeia archaeon]
MHAGVPQFIDVEDKIAFGLTGKQLLWMGGGVALMVVAYTLFDQQLFFAVSFFIALIFGAFAFWRPQGVPMITFLSFTLQFFLKPKSYIWKRVYSQGNLNMKKASLAQTKNAPTAFAQKHLPERGQLKRIAWELDTKR